MIYHLIASVCLAHVTCWMVDREFTSPTAKADCLAFGVSIRDKGRRTDHQVFFECKEIAPVQVARSTP